MNQSQNPPPGRAMGKIMIAAGFMLGIGLLTTLFNGILQRQANPNGIPAGSMDAGGVREVVLQRNRQGHYVSGGHINGEPVQFLLDTGASDLAIPLVVAQRTGLAPGIEGRAMTANGTAVVYDTSIDELALGTILLRDIDASIVPSMGGETILLGMSALRQIEFSQRGSALTLRQLPTY